MAKSLCNSHYLRLYRYGRLNSVKRQYGTGGYRKDGYKLISENGVRILEHRSMMQKFIGRKLLSNEVIHHKNGDRQDNRIENLILTNHSEHRKYHKGNPRKRMSAEARENIREAMKLEYKNRKIDPITGHFVSSKI